MIAQGQGKDAGISAIVPSAARNREPFAVVAGPQIISLALMLLRFINEINKCNVSSPNMGIIPLTIGIPTSAIGTLAKSAIIIDIASSKGCS